MKRGNSKMNENTNKGMSVGTVVQIFLIILKLAEVITWSWWIVLLPTIIPLIMLGATGLVFGIIYFAAVIITRGKKNEL
jgi:hypothetical protein